MRKSVMTPSVLSLTALTMLGTITAATAADEPTPEPSTSTSADQQSKVEREVSNSAELTKVAEQAKSAGLNVTQDKTRSVTVEHGAGDQAVADAEGDTASQIKTLEAEIKAYQTKKAAHDDAVKAYEEAKAEYDKAEAQYQKDQESYEKAKAEYDTKIAQYEKDSEAYQAAVAEYEAQSAEHEKALAEYQEKKDAYDKASEQYVKDVEAYNAAKKQYDEDLTAYNAAKATYDKLVSDQIDNADPDTALTPSQLAYEQPYKLNENRNSLASVTGVGTTDVSPAYNSDRAVRFTVTNDTTATITWKNVAKDKQSGKSLDATIKVSNIQVASNSPDNDQDSGNSGSTPSVIVYSNFVDNLRTWNVANIGEQLSFNYSDGGAQYNKRTYVTAGSLNAQGTNRKLGARYEYAAPGDGVVASFLNTDSEIGRTVQDVHGDASAKVKQAFMYPQGSAQSGAWTDSQSEALTKMGVTFLADPGAMVNFGVSGGSGDANPQNISNADGRAGDSVTGGGTYAFRNHIMLSTSTVAPTATEPVKPTEPIPPTKPEVPTPPQDMPDAPVPPSRPTQPVAPVAPIPPETVPQLETPEVSYHLNRVFEQGAADIKLNKAPVSLVGDTSTADRTMTYAFQVKNDGASTDKSVVLHEDFGEGIDPASITWENLPEGAVVADDNKSVTLGDYAPGQEATIMATATVKAGYTGDQLKNSAHVTTETEPKKGDNCEQKPTATVDEDTDGCDDVTVDLPKPNMKIHKVFTNESEVKAGGQAEFSVQVKNDGAGGAGQVKISDLPIKNLSDIKVTDVKIDDPGTPVTYTENLDGKQVPFLEQKNADAEPTASPSASASATAEPSETAEPTAEPSVSASESPEPSASASASVTAEPSASPSASASAGETPEYTIEGNTVTFPAMLPGETVTLTVTGTLGDDLSGGVENHSTVTTPDDPEKGKKDGKTNPDLPSDDDGFDGVTYTPKKEGETPAPSSSASETPSVEPSSPAPSQGGTDSTPAPSPSAPNQQNGQSWKTAVDNHKGITAGLIVLLLAIAGGSVAVIRWARKAGKASE